MLNAHMDPMCYPLMFSYGEMGYDYRKLQNLANGIGKRITLREFTFQIHRIHRL